MKPPLVEHHVENQKNTPQREDIFSRQAHHKPFGKIPEYQIYQNVSAYLKIYPKFNRLIVFDFPVKQRIPGFETTDKKIKRSILPKKQIINSMYDSSYDSIRRTKTKITDLSLCNEFSHFATFTFSKDRQDIQKCKQKMSNWLFTQQKIHGKFQYLIVPEFHKDGKSIHFHALINNYKGKMVDSGHKINGRTTYNISSYRSGFSTAVEIDNHEKVSSYIRKYITKNMPKFENKKRYWSSTQLIRPKTVAQLTTEIHRNNGYTQTFQKNGLTVYEKSTIITPQTNKEKAPHGRYKTNPRSSKYRRLHKHNKHHTKIIRQ